VAISRVNGRLDGGLILLRGCPFSGADEFATAATWVLGRQHQIERQWVVDLDNPAMTASIAGRLASAPAGAATLVKTHLSRQAFARLHPDLLSQVRGEIRMFRPPLDVALASHGYLSTVPGTLAEGEHRFDGFLERWLAQEGNCSGFVTLEFAGWADLAREALDHPASPAWPAVDIALEDLARAPVTVASDALGLPPPTDEPAGADLEAVATSATASGALGKALNADALASAVADCVTRFGGLVNQLIRQRRISLSII
jgi:hypothetical protein